MTRKKLLVFGTGVMGELIADHFIDDSPWKVAAFVSHQSFIDQPMFKGLPVVPFEKIEATHPPSDYAMFIALSYGRVNRTRRKVYEDAKAKGYTFASYISRHARSLKPIIHGDNVFLNESVVQPGASIGNNVIIWSNNVIGHHSVVGDHCFISSGVVISGNTTVGESCFFGVNSCCRENLFVAPGTIVGAGATLMRNSQKNTSYISPSPLTLRVLPESEDFLVRPKRDPETKI